MISGTPSKDPVSTLILELSKLPGIGEKTATRLAHWVLRQDAAYARALSDALITAKQKTSLCRVCFNFTDAEVCRICSDAARDRTVVCVVERPTDVFALEQSGMFRGTYHVLHGALSPLDGIGPEDIKIRELLARIQAEESPVREVILATNPSVEGEATSLYLARLIRPCGIQVTKLASGIPVGGMLEYTDRQTIGRALENRMEIRG